MRASSTLPPLPALRVFEAAARLLSFRRAGEELLITQSAVSHHIRQLEETLGVPLFVRKARGVALTPEGAHCFAVTTDAFQRLAGATSQLRALGGRETLRVSLLPSFMANWLLARLPGFQALCPAVAVELDPSLRLADVNANEADLAIRYGDGRWPDVDARPLMTERLSPIVSPDLLRRDSGLASPADLLRHPLLMPKRSGDWTVWAKAAGLDLSQARVIQLTDYNIVLQAAIGGQGVAMGRSLLIRDHIAAGRLVCPVEQAATSASGHWIVSSQRRGLPRAARRFADWLAQEIAAENTQASAPDFPKTPFLGSIGSP